MDNGISTINTNLTDYDHIILNNAPDFKSPFTQIGLQSMDFIMSQNSPGKKHIELSYYKIEDLHGRAKHMIELPYDDEH